MTDDPQTDETIPESSPEAPEAPESAEASTGPTGSPFVGNTGPGFSTEAGSAEPPPSVAAALVIDQAPEVTEEQVRDFLLTIGDGVHSVAGVGELDWVMTQRDLERIVPPATRIVNRYEPAQRVMSKSDFLALAAGSGLYAWRSMLERQAVLEARAQQAAAAAPPAPPSPHAQNPTSPVPPAEIPSDYIPLSERLRATRPEGE